MTWVAWTLKDGDSRSREARVQSLCWMRETTESFGLIGREGAAFSYAEFICLLETRSLRTRSATCLALRLVSTLRQSLQALSVLSWGGTGISRWESKREDMEWGVGWSDSLGGPEWSFTHPGTLGEAVSHTHLCGGEDDDEEGANHDSQRGCPLLKVTWKTF